MNVIDDYLQQIKQKGLYRKRDIIFAQNSGILQFSSNDYLSLTNDPEVMAAYQHGFAQYPTGSGGSMVVCGYHEIHQELETAFAQALNVDDCLLFSSGSAANVSVMQFLAKINQHVLIDKGVHASIYDGLKNTSLAYTRYNHNDLNDLVYKLHAKPITLITESIFSMSGSIAPLKEIYDIIQSPMIIDEAHAFGVLGVDGLGGVAAAGLTQAEVPLRIIPFGKAFGACGAIVAGKASWIDALLQTSRAYIYSTGFSPAFAYGLLETLSIVRLAHDKRAKLQNLVSYFREKISQSSLKWRESYSPIQQLQLGCPHLALKYTKILREKGIICMAMRQPTVSLSDTGLRIILNANHEFKHIDQLFRELHAI